MAKLRTKNMKAQFNDWAFFIGSKSSASQRKSLRTFQDDP
ncbi:hypothetical protein YPPY66_2685 [Yersinia pestis PY-66]|uniref:Uncharacterized protein n=1 Tax=Yersinia pestis PY-08 TaxID=992134 RepID=A0AB72ZJP5_YERPE|nr:hypothetical protein YpF1991016_2765 [Yersinia pestis biovar Orientalis str. F1991016]EIQ89928.1 hypothetical protein YPPY02_2424 [Yersinia pestis PY-02]EIQ90777.1 hypothetical protein YPPY03_2476 [Yersinia pestis PY-03]EIR02018.1 hypothetical protein YPPY04_2460 [Yersinia pestis PY-04]EIR06643.1 hypothetical protein YPPY06_2489 [Yersinia pestis PY-06]EIR18481.1 hypothetical protein YPPY08_2466 [Yersinia pestis PY-08]EIR33744.1 hypothetical protein YPPY11_2567 [Yersinia pestis PY-11]EIR47